MADTINTGKGMEPEKELVKRILAGDREAQTLFYQEIAPRLFSTSIHFLGYEDPEAEDVVQQAFLIAFRKLGEFEFRSSLYTWVAHICVNLCHERLRARKRVLASLHEDLEKLTLPLASSVEERKREEEEKQGQVEALRQLIQTMGEKCRKILELRDLQGESYIGISHILHLPPGTVMSQLARCRKALKVLLESGGKEVGS